MTNTSWQRRSVPYPLQFGSGSGGEGWRNICGTPLPYNLTAPAAYRHCHPVFLWLSLFLLRIVHSIEFLPAYFVNRDVNYSIKNFFQGKFTLNVKCFISIDLFKIILLMAGRQVDVFSGRPIQSRVYGWFQCCTATTVSTFTAWF